MFYEIKRESDGLYLHSNGQCISPYAEPYGRIGNGPESVRWVEGAGNGFGVSSLEFAEAIARYHGAIVVPAQCSN